MKTPALLLMLTACYQLPTPPLKLDQAANEVRQMLNEAMGCDWANDTAISRGLWEMPADGFQTAGVTSWSFTIPPGPPTIRILPLIAGPAGLYDTDGNLIGMMLEDWQKTLVHEFGHVAGLSHSYDPDDVMNKHGCPKETELYRCVEMLVAKLHCPVRIALRPTPEPEAK